MSLEHRKRADKLTFFLAELQTALPRAPERDAGDRHAVELAHRIRQSHPGLWIGSVLLRAAPRARWQRQVHLFNATR